MGLQGIDWQVVQFPLAGGLDTKAHGQLLDPPGLSMCKNVEFDEAGALRLRKPYAGIGTNIYPSGTLSNVRKFAVVGDELLCFTSAAVYSWSETLTAWVSRGEHLAVASTEAAVFGNTSDQVFADRAQLGNTIVYVWTEVANASFTTCYIAARDATTGATTLAPTSLGSSTSRPRVVATDTVLFVTWVSLGIGLKSATVSPTAPAVSGLVTIDASEESYDIVRHPSADQVVVLTHPAGGASYTVSKVTTAGAITSSTKARTADDVQPVAIACAPSAVDRVQVVRQDGINIYGDLLVLSTLADVYTGQPLGATGGTVYQIAAAFRSVTTGGFYRCYVFWSLDEADATNEGTGAGTFVNYVDTNNTLGSQAVLVYRNGIASRAFDYGGSVFVWTVFAAANNVASPGATVDRVLGFEVPIQSSCFLHRDDGDYFAKAAWQRAGGYGYSVGHLAGVALVSGSTGYAWATTERGFTDLGGYFNSAGYGARAPRDVVFTFDSDDARRVVQVGRTAYISGGLILQYDGEGLAEVGFDVFPHFIETIDSAAGAIAAGDYSYKSTLRWDNARGETERSTTAIGYRQAVAASRKVTWWVSRLRTTKKRSTRRDPSNEMWRTAVNPSLDSPYYLITSRDPSSASPNNYVANDPSAIITSVDQTDNMTDDVLTTKEQHPENGAVLPRFAPPPATIVIASDTRIFLAGIPGDPYVVVYSLLRNEGEIAGFHGSLRFTVPASTGPITGLALQSETLVVFTASAVYVIPGDGFDNTGGGSNYGPPRMISTDVGCISHDTLALTPQGLVFFSRKGWYRLSPGWDLEYIGAKVEDFNADTWVAAQVMESQHQVRLLSSSRMIVWDYLVNEWSEWTQASGRDLATWRGSAMLLDSAVKKEQSTFSTVDYDFDVASGWFKPSQLQGMARVRRVAVLGEYKAAHKQRIRIGFDYAGTYTDDAKMTFTGLTAGNPTQLRQGPSRQRCEAIRVRVTITSTTDTTPAYDAVTLTGLAFEVGVRRGLYARLPAAQKQ